MPVKPNSAVENCEKYRQDQKFRIALCIDLSYNFNSYSLRIYQLLVSRLSVVQWKIMESIGKVRSFELFYE